MTKLIKSSARYLFNIPGWNTKRKIIVIESDDWGSIRMPDKQTYDRLLSRGIRVDKCPYNRYDSLASEDDLGALYETLNAFRDISGNPPIITANCIMGNPDFEKIRDSGFKDYHYEVFTETLKKYPQHSNSFTIWEDGIRNNLFYPQFHGREHLNVKRWMNALKLDLPETRFGFDQNLYGISKSITSENRKSYLEAFAATEEREMKLHEKIISEGLSLFKKIFGFKSKSFIAPNYVWSSRIEEELGNNGVKYLQGMRIQNSPGYNSDPNKKIHHYIGQVNKFGQIYTVRNCLFEPSLINRQNSVDECLANIRIAFQMHKPAIIRAHRLNFIGSIDISNRDVNLRQLKELFTRIKKYWPETEFMTTDKLGNIISNEKFGRIK